MYHNQSLPRSSASRKSVSMPPDGAGVFLESIEGNAIKPKNPQFLQIFAGAVRRGIVENNDFICGLNLPRG